jgi:hypothetical protein
MPVEECTINVVFLMVAKLRDLAKLGAHVRASSTVPVCLHLVGDSVVHADLAVKWGMHAHSLDDMPVNATALHRGFEKVTHGPGAIYMWKPLLHYLLPFRTAIVLDSDIGLVRDLAELEQQFDRFEPGAVMGLATEQAPFYYQNGYPKTGGVNGGVQLLHLERMRRPGSAYEAELQRFAAGERGDIGYLGDQNFYTKLRMLRPELVHALDCGWNRQLSHHLWGPTFLETHACGSPCALVHGNFPTFKGPMMRLQDEAPGSTGRPQRLLWLLG